MTTRAISAAAELLVNTFTSRSITANMTVVLTISSAIWYRETARARRF